MPDLHPVSDRILFVINPKSGTGGKEKTVPIIRKFTDESIFRYDIRFTERAGHATEIAARAAQEGFGAVVAVGGDGTVNETARALIDTETALGIIPAGSGNGLARHLGIPQKMSAAIRHLHRMQIGRIDAGFLNGRPFFCTAGLGFDAHIADLFSKADRRGLAGYGRLVMREFATYRPQDYLVKTEDGQIEITALVLAAANAAQFGNNVKISPLADISDGVLDLCALNVKTAGGALRLLAGALGGFIHRQKGTDIYRLTDFEVLRENAGPVHLDGEPMMMPENLLFSIKKQCLKVLV